MPVEIPLDRICVRTGVLCPRCQSLVDRGLYDELDIRVMRTLLSIERRLGDARIKYVKTLRLDNRLVVLVEAPGGSLPGWLGKELQMALDDPSITRVIVVPHGGGVQKLVEHAVKPFKVVDVSVYYSPDGKEYYIVRLSASAKGKIDRSLLRVVEKLAEKWYGKGIIVEYVETPREEASEKISISELRSLLDKIDRF